MVRTKSVTQPELSSDPGNILGGSTFACTQQTGLDWPATGDDQQFFWRVFDHQETGTGSDWQVGDINGVESLDLYSWYWGKFYTPNPTRLNTFSWRVHVQPEYGIRDLRIYASNDDRDYKLIGWKQDIEPTSETYMITILDENFYRYFKVECRPQRTDWMLLTDVWYTGIEMQRFALQQSKSLTKFNQPTLTENGVWGGDSFAVSASSEHTSGGYGAYRAFDGDSTTDWHPDTPYEQPHEIKWYNPNPLFIDTIDVSQTGAHGYCVRDYQLLASNDDVNYQLIQNGHSTAVKDETFTIDVHNTVGYRYWSLKSISSNHESLSPIVTYGEIKINAKERQPTQVRTLPWTQPVLTEKPTTEFGGSEFACDEDQDYLVTDSTGVQNIYNLFNTGVDDWQYNGAPVGTSFFGVIYNPDPLIVKSIALYNHNAVQYAPAAVRVYGSNDNKRYTLIGANESWPDTQPDPIVIQMTNRGPWKYLKLEMVSKNQICCVLSRMEITADQYVDHGMYCLQVCKKWQQPVLTDTPTISSDNFWTDEQTYYLASNTTPGTADYKQQMQRLFDGSTFQDFQINTVDVDQYYWGKFYNPKPLLITDMQICSSQPQYYPAEIIISGSNDDIEYHRLGTIVAGDSPSSGYYPAVLTSTGFYKYYKIECKPRTTTAIIISLIKITGYEQQ